MASRQASLPVAESRMMPLSEEKIRRNMRDVAHAIAQQELEGVKVSPETIADMEGAARGEIDSAEVIRRIHQRLDTAAANSDKKGRT